MDKLDPKQDGASPDIVADNLDRLRQLFPEAFTESSDENGPRWKVDFDALKETLDDYVEDKQERYQFNWNGKARARRIAQTPSAGTLLPCPEESVNWDSTQNIFIEGDNLEVLKLLQKSYHKKVKMIYIDPPYNTGKEFIYPDRFQDNLDTYLRYTGQKDADGFKTSTNSESSGRYHTNWLNMMYPRLKLARNLLRDDGVIFISIDDNELFNLKKVCDEVFGEENFVANLIWKSRQNRDNRPENGVSIDHEYIVCYGASLRGDKRDLSQYSNPDDDPRGDWASANMVGLATKGRRPNLHYDLINPSDGVNYGCPHMGWRYDKKTMDRLIKEGRILWPASTNGRPRKKAFASELKNEYVGFPSIVGHGQYTRTGTSEVNQLFGFRAMDFPKPVRLVQQCVEQSTANNDLVLDFFAGSCPLSQAVSEVNILDGGTRRFVAVQLPEVIENNAAASAEGLQSIADVGKERLRRAGKKIKEDNPDWKGDTGFKVYKLAASNIVPWLPDEDDIKQSLLDNVDNIRTDRSEQDVLYELLLKYGLDLAVPVEEREIAGKTVFVIGAGALVVCLARDVGLDTVKGIAALKDELTPKIMRVVFKDASFTDDVVKTNAVQVLHQAGIDDVKSL